MLMRSVAILAAVACLFSGAQLQAQTPPKKCDVASTETHWQPRCMACHTQDDVPPKDMGWHWGGGASYYSLQPFLNNNAAFGFTTASLSNGGNSISGLTQTQQFGWGMQPAFDVWLEATSPQGLGIRARWFHMDGASSTASLSVPSGAYGASNLSVIAVTPSPTLFNAPPGTVPQQNPALAGLFGGPSPFVVNFPGAPASTDRFTFDSQIRLDAVDLEATGSWYTKSLVASGGVGGRYFKMTQGYNALLVNENATGATLNESLNFNQVFNGGGPTVSGLVSWHPIHPNFSVYGGGRASLVVGESTQTTTGRRTLNDPTGAFNPIGAPTSTSNSFSIPTTSLNTIPIAELEAGVEATFFQKRSSAFVRAGAVNQTYFGVGNASGGNGNLSLLGFKITAGFMY
jgi:hypothetical protein